jgi:hypothetical protein
MLKIGTEKRRQEPRVARRDRVIKTGVVLIGETTINCIVRDISITGARISFPTPILVPAVFSLRVSDGSTYPAVRRWMRGLEVGLEFTAAPSAAGNEGDARRAFEALAGLKTSITAHWLEIVRAERYFGDEALRQAAEAVETAHAQLKTRLQLHAFRTPSC